MKLTDLYIKHKAEVDFVVIGLTLMLGMLGFGALGMIAFLSWKATGTLVYAAIVLVGLIMLIVGLIPAYRMRKIIKRMENERI